MKAIKPVKRNRAIVSFLSLLLIFSVQIASGQMRQVYLDTDEDNEVKKISFYSASSGYVAFTKWIGFTSDTGRTFTKKYITLQNVNYNGYTVNLTFGFIINGVKAFNQNNLIVYGHYGFVPAILYSTDAGNSFQLVHLSSHNESEFRTIEDMIFPQNGNIGFAVDADRILKTTNGGLTWFVVLTSVHSDFNKLEASDNSHVYAMCLKKGQTKILKSANEGINWSSLNLPYPNADLRYAYFLTADIGWLSTGFSTSDGYEEHVYKTTNGGNNWTLQNIPKITPLEAYRFHFVDENTGYALQGQNTVYKTTNSGASWEPLPRDNNYSHLLYSHNDLYFWSSTQFWAGGGHGFLELTTNGGGIPLPKAFFSIDTVGLASTGIVKLSNHSKTTYSSQWLLNGNPLSNTYNAAYSHDIDRIKDTITLIVSNGSSSDTTKKFQEFHPRLVMTSFSPMAGNTGTVVTITGDNFYDVQSVSFGTVSAASFVVVSSTSIQATIGDGASGNVVVVTSTGVASLPGFIYTAPPTISGFSPVSATAGTTVTITGSNFIGTTAVSFGGTAATSYTVISSSVIVAVVPSSASGVVSVTTPAGTASLAGFISIPDMLSFSPQMGTIGTVITITGTSFTGVTGVTIGGVPAESFSVLSTTVIKAVVGNGGSGSVVITKGAFSTSLPGFIWVPAPKITGYSPASGAVGTTLVITGHDFSSIAANNTVYFGAVKANVISSSQTSITVTVPVGASFEPISVTTNYLTGYSAYPFLVTFPNGGSISATSFIDPKIVVCPDNVLVDVKAADLDNDGKIDLVIRHYDVTNSANNGIYLFRNTSTTAEISFDSPINLIVGDQGPVAITDLDGDGKLDLVIAKVLGDQGAIMIYRNTSSTGNFSFAIDENVPTSKIINGLSFADVNGDGKADIIISSYQGLGVTIFRNISNPGVTLFAPGFSYDNIGTGVATTDLDGDSKPEIIVTEGIDGYLRVLKNNSTVKNVDFEAIKLFDGHIHKNLGLADIDGDGKTDLISDNTAGSRLVIFRNKSSLGNFEFESPIKLEVNSEPGAIAITDLDGDGKVDIGVSLRNYSLAVYKNFSSPGNIKIAPQLNYAPTLPYGSGPVTVADLNGDGKNDLIVLSEIQRSFFVHVNKVKPEPFIESFTPSIGEVGTSVNIVGSNFTGVTAVSFGNVPAASFQVISPKLISAVVGNGAAGEVSVTNGYGQAGREGFVFGFPPEITSILPLTGPVGATVIIQGKKFSPVIGNNIVSFGNVRATVTAASPTSLSVIVPPGLSHQPFNVTVNNRTANSEQYFTVTFNGVAGEFSASSFAEKVQGPVGYIGATCDFDADGKIDLLTLVGSNTLIASRNISTPGVIKFDNGVIPISQAQASGFELADIDGDGKMDLVVNNGQAATITLWRNTSIAGSISFIAAGTYPSGGVADIAVKDLDSDGKPDIVVANYEGRFCSVFKNQSSPGSLVLTSRIDYAVNGYANAVTIRDINADNKPELIVALSQNKIVIFNNISIPGAISFAEFKSFEAGNWPISIKTCDLNGDMSPDIITANISGNNISTYQNNSENGQIDMLSKQDYSAGIQSSKLSVGDLDGDGKPDIAVTNNNSPSTLSFFRNNSTNSLVTLQEGVHIPLSSFAYGSAIADIDTDGIPDIIVFTSDGTQIFRNQSGVPKNIMSLCAFGNVSLNSTMQGTSYQWQENAGGGFMNLFNGPNISGSTTSTLQLTNLPTSWYGNQYRCVTNLGTSQTTIIHFANTWTGAAGNAWNNPSNWSCGTVPDGNTDVAINSGTVVLSSDASVRSLTLKPGVTFTIAPGFKLTITH